MKPSVFLSHNRNDKDFAHRLANDLRRAGAEVWLDEAEIKLGDSLIAKIGEGLEMTDYLAVILSPDSVASSWVQRELQIALNHEVSGRRVTVLPLLYRDCSIPTFLSDKLYADFRDPLDYYSALQIIEKRLGLPLTSGPEVEIAGAPPSIVILEDLVLQEIQDEFAGHATSVMQLRNPDGTSAEPLDAHMSVPYNFYGIKIMFSSGPVSTDQVLSWTDTTERYPRDGGTGCHPIVLALVTENLSATQRENEAKRLTTLIHRRDSTVKVRVYDATELRKKYGIVERA